MDQSSVKLFNRKHKTMRHKAMKQKTWVLFIVLFHCYGVMPFAQGAELVCRYLYDIQKKFLDQHINFSNVNKRKRKMYFKTLLSGVERRTQEQFIKSLDMEKLYFTRRDIRNIKQWMHNNFDRIRQKDCSILDRIYHLYSDRVLERVEFAKKYLKSLSVIDNQLKLVLDSRKRSRPSSQSGLNVFHKKYIHYQLANAIIASDEKQYKDQLKSAKKDVLRSYGRLRRRVKSWEVNLSLGERRRCAKKKKVKKLINLCKPDKWYSIYLSSFAHALDPHSSYLSREDQEDFEINMRLSLDGIGASLGSKYGHTIIERLIPGGVAARSGLLKPKDKILAVGQTRWNMVNIFEMSLRDVVSLIRGKRGTAVYLRILRVNKNVKKNVSKNQKNHSTIHKKKFTVRLVRDRVNLEDQAASLFYFNRTIENKKYLIGVISVPSFYGDGRPMGRSVSNDVKKLLKKARRKAEAIVLDLSNNGGGSLLEAIRVAGLFFSHGAVVRQLVRTRSGDRYLTLSDIDKEVEYKGPLVVLINRVSASASEIVAGTLQSYQRAVIVGGDHTFGKGSIQSVEPLKLNLGSIRVTVGLFFIPSGFSTQLHGVPSDIVFPSVFSNEDIGEKELDYVLSKKEIPSFLSKSAYTNGDKWYKVNQKLFGFLESKSKIRINKSEKFHKIREDIAELKLRKKKGYAITIAEIFSEAKKEESENLNKEEEESKEDIVMVRKKKYRLRADVQEAVNIAADFTHWNQHVKVVDSSN